MLVVLFFGPPPCLDGWCELITYSGAFFFFFQDDCLLIKTKCDIEGLFCNRFCRAFLSILNTKAYQHALFFFFLRSWDTFYHGVNTLPSCALSHLCLSDQINFFSWEFANVLFSGNLQCHGGLFQCSIQCINWYRFSNKTVVFHIFGLVVLSSYYSI